MPRLRGRLLALAVQTGDWLVQNPRQTAVMTVDPLDVGLVLAWFQAYYPKSRNRLRVQVHE